MESEVGIVDLVAPSFDVRYSFCARQVLDEMPDCFTITDPSISGNPIVYASPCFLKLSGYSRDEVVGRNGRMFQGQMTCRRSVMEIREAVRFEKTVEMRLLNYRKDGSSFWILFHLRPIYSREDGKVIHFLSVHVPLVKKMKMKMQMQRRGWSNGNGFCRSDVGGGGSDTVNNNEAGDLEEKMKARSSVSNILSVLTHYSELTGRLVCSSLPLPLAEQEPAFPSSLNIILGRIKQSFVLTNPQLDDMPIVYASEGFLELTGYDRSQVLGRNCRFLSGEYTDFGVTSQIKESIQAAKPCSVRILNYRKDGSSFWNLLHISPVRNATGMIAYYVGVQIEECGKNMDAKGLSPEQRQRSVVGSVKVAVRSLSIGTGSVCDTSKS